MSIKGLVGHWRLDKESYNPATGIRRFTDQSAYCNHGISANPAVFSADRMGQPDRATIFNGTSDYIDCGDSDIYNFTKTDPFTIAAWMYNASTPTTWEGHTLITNQNSADLFKGWNVLYDMNKHLVFSITHHTEVWHSLSVISAKTYNKLGWIHVIAINTGVIGEQALYINGIEDNGIKANNTDTFSYNVSHNVIIGKRGNTVDSFHDGSIAEPRIYNRVLTSAERTLLFESYRR